MTFITATTMPLLIALAEVGLTDGVMIPANAAALVGAGVLSVLIYPSIAAAVSRRDRAAAAPPQAGSGGSSADAGPGPGPGPGAAGEPGAAPAA
jgi:hypothetical protein